MRRMNLTGIIDACYLCFTGSTDQEAADKLDVTPAIISGWRKLALWKETEMKYRLIPHIRKE